MLLKIVIPDLPPSVNVLYKRTRKGGLYVNPKVTAFKELVKQNLPDDINCEPVKLLKLDIAFHGCKHKSDLDNFMKVLLDSMNKLVYADDKQIYQIVATKVLGSEKQTIVIVSDYLDSV